VTITEAYFTGAEYVGTECKYEEPYGTDLALTIGTGEQSFSFVRSAKVRATAAAAAAAGSRHRAKRCHSCWLCRTTMCQAQVHSDC